MSHLLKKYWYFVSHTLSCWWCRMYAVCLKILEIIIITCMLIGENTGKFSLGKKKVLLNLLAQCTEGLKVR